MDNTITIRPIAHFRSPLTSKFGIPRQSGIVEQLEGEVVFEKQYNNLDAIRGIEGFDYIWLIWGFSEAKRSAGNDVSHLTVRPPRLGGNTRLGVFATRSPFRPNPLGLSCVRIDHEKMNGEWDGRLHVLGADLMDGTPIYDIKPYIPYADAHPDATAGFTERAEWQQLTVFIPEDIGLYYDEDDVRILEAVLAEDPRPRYHDDPERIYGMPFHGHEVKFRVMNNSVIITEIQ